MSTEVVQIPKAAQAEAIVNNHIAWATGAGLIPFPLFDLAAIVGVQLKMLKEMSELYGVEFRENRVKSIVASLFTGVGSTSVAVASVGTVAKLVPGIGSILGVVTLPVVAGAFTYAIGKIFIQHFESGGTFLTFDSLDAKSGFQREFEKGKVYVSGSAKKLGNKVADTSTKIEDKIDAAIDTVCR